VPEAPTDGNTYGRTGSTTTWTLVYNQTQSDARYLKLAGGTLTGTLTLNADPASALQAATKQYVDNNIPAQATAAQYLNGTALKYLSGSTVWAAAAPVALTDAATVTPDFNTGIDFTWTLGAVGRTLANPVNAKAGQKGVIYLVQDATGSRTITTYGSAYKFPGGIKPTLTTTAGATDCFSYVCLSSSIVLCFFSGNFA
jgi:hypothetical protein